MLREMVDTGIMPGDSSGRRCFGILEDEKGSGKTEKLR